MVRCRSAPNGFTTEKAPVKNGHTAALEMDSSAASSAKSDSLSMSSSSLFDIDNSAVEYAQRIWNEDSTVYNNNLDHIVEWIGNGKVASNAILKAYLGYFDFKGLKLEQAFRNLCSKLHLKGETQQIDRIFSEFAGRYFQWNPKCIFGSTGKVIFYLPWGANNSLKEDYYLYHYTVFTNILFFFFFLNQ
jgi:Sec7-like guanine-nucleotide exchange factor